jgi:hypothetical protein
MSSRSPAVLPVSELREAVQQRVSVSSLRAVAAETGLSWKAIDNFLAGSSPYRRNVQKLTEWYLRQAAAEDAVPSAETAAAALYVLVRHFPPAQRAEATAALVATLRNVGEAHGVILPAWLME